MSDELIHYGTPRHSGRYPWGSGENPYQRNADFLANYKQLKAKGLSDTEVAKAMNMSVNEMRSKRSLAREQENTAFRNKALRLRAKGYGPTEIARRMSTEDYPVNESTVRGWLSQAANTKKERTDEVAKFLKEKVDAKNGYIDIGLGAERELGITRNKLQAAVQSLKDQGYEVIKLQVEQQTNPGNYTTVQVLCPEGTTWAEVRYNRDKIEPLTEYFPNGVLGGVETAKPPKSISSDRVYIKYKEDGGSDMDGVIFLRPGVEDLSMGPSQYAQVRIGVDDKMYIKGMAVYSNDIPDGYDILVNSNKSKENGMEKALKPLKSEDPDLPFGAVIYAKGQYTYTDKDGNEQLGVVNRIKDQGEWDTYSKTLPSQFLAKQDKGLIKRQLDLTYAEKLEAYDDIQKIKNPALKQNELNAFAELCDSSASDLKASALPRQSTKVILPLTDIKDNEVYAPTYRDGEKVCLVRYPHGGIFEIPTLTVNNKNKQGKEIVHPDSIDAIGINKNVADRLSGADFDGDTVTVIPLSRAVDIRTKEPLEGLKGFDTKDAYGPDQVDPVRKDNKGHSYYTRNGVEYQAMTKENTQRQMGIVSNLITDMTIRGATDSELARAVRHSMVVIDAEKHHLDYKQSERDNDIQGLKRIYQAKGNDTYGGASTLLSIAGAERRVPQRHKYTHLDEEGNKIYKETGATYFKPKKDKDGNVILGEDGKPLGKNEIKTDKIHGMDTVKDAYELSSGTQVENIYAKYANDLKALANKSRLEAASISSKDAPVASESVKRYYSDEIRSIKKKIDMAELNRPRERMAQIAANIEVDAKKKDNPNMDAKEKKKVAQVAVAKARARYGAKKRDVEIHLTDRELEAVQAGAVSFTQQRMIFKNMNSDEKKIIAYGHSEKAITQAKLGRIKAMHDAGYTLRDIADQLGVSTSTVSRYMNE